MIKHHEVSKYYDTDWLQNFLLLFMFASTTKFVKNSHISARLISTFLKNVLKQSWNSFNTNFKPQWKGLKSSYQANKILRLFCHSVALTLRQNSVKSLKNTKKDKETNYEWICGELESQKSILKQSVTKELWLILVFMWNSAQPEKFNFFFQEFFYYCINNLGIQGMTWPVRTKTQFPETMSHKIIETNASCHVK